MESVFETIRRLLLGPRPKSEKYQPQLAALMDAVNQAADVEQANQHARAVAEFLESASADRGHHDVKELLANGYFDLGFAYRMMGREADAEACYSSAISTLESLKRIPKHAGHARSGIAACQNHLGLLYLENGKLDKAIPALDDAITRRREIVGRSPADAENKVYLAGALCNRGHVAREAGDAEAAMALYDESLQLLERSIPKCDCGCHDALAEAVSRFEGHPHWILVAHDFRRNAEEGRRLLAEVDPSPNENSQTA